MISKESAMAKANDVRAEIKYYDHLIVALKKAIPVMKKFDGKVINARFKNALNAAVKDVEGNFSFGGVNGYEFGVRAWMGKYYSDSMVYSFMGLMGGLSEVRVYNRETQLSDKTVTLFTIDNGKLRIVAEGWETLFNSYIDLYEERIKARLPYESAEFILEKYREKEQIEAEIRKLEDKVREAVPSFLR